MGAVAPFQRLSEGSTQDECLEIYNDFYGRGGWRVNPKTALRTLRRIANTAGWAEGAQILELGCGTGHHAALLASLGFRVTAVDRSDVGIARARKRYKKPTYIHADVTEFRSPKMDGIFVRGMSFFHYELHGVNRHGIDVPAQTERMFQWLKRGGTFVLQISTDFSGRRPDGFIHHNKRSDYVSLFEPLGEIVSVTNWNGVPLANDDDARKRGKGSRSGIIITTRKT